jgi:antitoxin YefM
MKVEKATAIAEQAWNAYTCPINSTSIGAVMKVINFSDARNQFKQVIDQVVADCDVTIISRRDAEDAVVMSLDTYNSIMETVHLLRTPANLKHLEKSLTQYRRGQIKARKLVDAH